MSMSSGTNNVEILIFHVPPTLLLAHFQSVTKARFNKRRQTERMRKLYMEQGSQRMHGKGGGRLVGTSTPHEPQQKFEESRGTKKFADAACIFFFCFIILYVPGACEIFTASAHVSLLLFVCIPSPFHSPQFPFSFLTTILRIYSLGQNLYNRKAVAGVLKDVH